MNHIIDEQIRIELGDEYERALKATRKYISKLIREYEKWGVPSAAAISGEGGMNSMMRNCMLTIIETGGIPDGLERYARRLAEEYISGNKNKKATSYEGLLEIGYTGGQYGDGQRESLETQLPSCLPSKDSGLQSTDSEKHDIVFTSEGDDDGVHLSTIIKTDEELELYEAIAATASLRDAAELIGMNYDYAKKLNHRVWNRVRYHVGTRGYRLAQVRS